MQDFLISCKFEVQNICFPQRGLHNFMRVDRDAFAYQEGRGLQLNLHLNSEMSELRVNFTKE